MAYINVAEWSVENVVDWLKGLDTSMYRYLTSFTNNQINGTQLLNIRPYELEELGIKSIGHQEIILEALEVLKNFHYNLDKENLQFLALHVATCAHSLYKQLSVSPEQDRIGTNTLKDVTRTISNVKKLIFWLDRKPFHGKRNYHEIRTNMLKLSLEMATCAQRGRFVVDPVKQISQAAVRLAKIADYVIQDISDPMLIQPASLALVTLKKRESDLGFYILPVMNGIHQIGDIKYNSPTHNSKQVEEGDEIVQINYQTVVGWQYEKVLLTLRECAPDVLLTIKKRPQDSKTLGQIYVKPYMKLPSKKRSFTSRWNDSLPSPREWTGTHHNYFANLKPLPEKHNLSDSDSSSSDISTQADIKESHKKQFYIPKSRGVLQRRHSICGDGYSMIKALDLMAANMYKDQRLDDSPSLRDKSISFGFGLEMRPTTHTGIGNTTQQQATKDKENVLDNPPPAPQVLVKPEIKPKPVERKLPPPPIPARLDLLAKEQQQQQNGVSSIKDEKTGELQGISKVVRFDSNTKLEASHIDTQYTCNIENTVLETFVPIPYVDEEVAGAGNTAITNEPAQKTFSPELEKTKTIPDKDVPPAIEPRQGKKKPVPPPRPSKTLNIVPNSAIIQQSMSHNTNSSNNNSSDNVPLKAIPGFIEVAAAATSEKMISNGNAVDENKSKLANVIALKSSCHRTVPEMPSPKEVGSGIGNESPLELHTSVGKALTLKKKNSLMSKRRKVSLKSFTSSDIQGHLYRRDKNRQGVTYWAKLYIVLIDTTLYGFKSKEASKADCLIFLPGFTVTNAEEIHSKEFAFKVYHPNKTFYFAAETKEAQRQWIDYINQAIIKGTVGQKAGGAVKDTKELFSETDSSDDETGSINASQLATPSPLMNHGSYSSGGKTSSGEPSTPTTTKSEGKYHLGFGSLKKSLRNLNSSEGSPSDNKFLSLFSSSRHSERKNSLDIPVPTSQFKSYRKMPVNVNIQAGTVTVSNKVGDSAMPSPKPAFEFPKRPSETFTFKEDTNVDAEEEEPIFEKVELGRQEAKKVVQKPSVYNHMHASNPNLVEFSVAGYDRAPKDIELTCPKTSSMNRDWDASHNTNGFMTLKDLMLLEQAENAKDPYNKRVCLGIEKHDDKNMVLNNNNQGHGKNEEKPVDNVNRTKINKIQKRSLPVTPDYAQSFKPDDQDILYTRSREGQKLRDFGYELITGDDRVELKNNLQAAQQQAQANHDEAGNRNNNKKVSKQNSNANETVMQSVKKRSMNWMHSSSHFSGADKDKSSIGGSFNKKQKNKSVVIEKFDHLMASSEKLFHFKHVNTANETENLKSKHTNVKPNVMTTNWNLVENHNGSGSVSGMTSSGVGAVVPQTSDRGASYLTKLSFSNKTSKEKKLLGSPRLHRAIFGHRNNIDRDEPKAVDHEIFSPLNFNNKNTNETANKTLPTGIINQAMEMDISPSSLAPPISLSQLTQHTDPNLLLNNLNAQNMNNNGNNNAPVSNSGQLTGEDAVNGNNIEYPPIFEAEIYSLSSNLLKRRHQNINK